MHQLPNPYETPYQQKAAETNNQTKATNNKEANKKGPPEQRKTPSVEQQRAHTKTNKQHPNKRKKLGYIYRRVIKENKRPHRP